MSLTRAHSASAEKLNLWPLSHAAMPRAPIGEELIDIPVAFRLFLCYRVSPPEGLVSFGERLGQLAQLDRHHLTSSRGSYRAITELAEDLTEPSLN